MGVVNMINDDIHRTIIDVKSIQLHSSLSVMDTIIDLIDKNDLITEYAENDIMNDIIMESMMIFMESKNRDRDKTPRNEISKWMEKKGYWYTGDNPKKKKECMRMYHFLQQHKFDPKDETYESDIKLKDGTKKRIKLNIDKFPVSENASLKNSVLKGNNAIYNTKRDDITIGSNLLKKNKQNQSQLTLKHEEGHANSRVVNNGGRYSEYGNRVRDFIDDYKGDWDNEKYVNKHDDSVEELKADEYGATHARIRTKDRGKGKQATRAYMLKDLMKVCTKMSEIHLKKGNDAAYELRKRRKDLLKKLDEKEKIRKTLSDIKGKKPTKEDIDHIFEICYTLKKYYILPESTIASSINDINACKDNISKWKSELEDLKKQTSNVVDIFDQMENQFEIDDIMKVIDKSTEKLKRITNELRNMIKSFKSDGVNINFNVVKGLTGKNLDDKKVQDELSKFLDKLINYTNNEMSINKTTIDQLDDAIKETKLVNDEGMEFSAALRYQYAKQFVKEYFKELYDDSNVFYD